MRILAQIVVFIVLFQKIEPRPGTARRNSSIKLTQRYSDSDSDSDDGFQFDDSSDDSGDDDDNGSYLWNSSDGCPLINEISDSFVSTTCVNGKLYINGEEIKNVKSTDIVDIIWNKLRINGEFIRRIPFPSDNYNSVIGGNVNIGNFSKGYSCPGVAQIGCINISHHCINGQFYVNGEKIGNVKSTDRVEIISNNLIINGEKIRYFPPSGNTGNDGDEFSDDEGAEDEENDDIESGEESEYGEENEDDEEISDGEEEDEDSDEDDDYDDDDDDDDDVGGSEEDEGDDEDEENDEAESGEEDEDGDEEEENEEEDNEGDEEDDEGDKDDEGDEEDEEETNDTESGEEGEDGGSEEDDSDNEENTDGEEEDEYEDGAPNVNMNFSNGINYGMKNGKFFVNDFELKNYKPTDRILIDHNDLYVNGKKICYIKPKFNFNRN